MVIDLSLINSIDLLFRILFLLQHFAISHLLFSLSLSLSLSLSPNRSHVSLYHALGKGTLSFLKGCLTLERVSFGLFQEQLIYDN